ncbi:hypothetical protein TWF281_002162 [Arthrobotrys megalospora]
MNTDIKINPMSIPSLLMPPNPPRPHVISETKNKPEAIGNRQRKRGADLAPRVREKKVKGIAEYGFVNSPKDVGLVQSIPINEAGTYTQMYLAYQRLSLENAELKAENAELKEEKAELNESATQLRGSLKRLLIKQIEFWDDVYLYHNEKHRL